MRIVVTGGRHMRDAGLVAFALQAAKPTELAHGGATGADTLADRWAKRNGIPVVCFPAAWDVYGPRAGMIRNGEMLRAFQPDHVYAFPGNTGTADCIKQARALGIPVTQFAR